MAGKKDVVGQALKLVAGSDPQKTVKAYKLFRQKDGKLYPLFVDANEEVALGEWLKAKAGEQSASGKVKSKLGELAYRPGWHAGDLPVATHIGARSHGDPKLPPDTRPSSQVWAEVEMADDVDWQKVANERARITKKGTPDPKTAHITDQVPFGGHYRYKTNPNMTGNWLIGGDMRVNRLLTDDEVKAINEAAGVSDLPRREGYAGKGRVVGDVVEQALKLTSGAGEEAAPAMRYGVDEIPSHLKPGFKVDVAPGADAETRSLVEYLNQRDPNLAFDPQSLEERRQDLGVNVPAYHGSPRNISQFSNRYSNPEGYWGGHQYFTTSPVDASENYATAAGPDLTMRLEREAENILDNFHPNDVLDWHRDKYGTEFTGNPMDPKIVKQFSDDLARQNLGITNEGAVYPVNLRMKNPVVIDSPNQTFWPYDVQYDEDGDIISEGGPAADLVEKTRQALYDYGTRDSEVDRVSAALYDEISNNGGIDAKTYRKVVGENVFDLMDDNGNMVSPGHVMADVFQSLGYDSIDMATDVFAGGLGRVGMPGTGGSTRHYIVFDPKNIRSRFGAFDPFKASSKRISDADGGRVEKADGGGFLRRATIGLLGPSERKGLSALTPPGSGYKGVPGKPSSVKLPFVGEAEAKPIPQIMDAATEYLKKRGVIGSHEMEQYPSLDEEFAMRVAEAYDRMKHAPDDPAVRRSYDAMAQETIDQLKAAEDAGIAFTAIRGKDPYAASPSLGYADIAERGSLSFFPTDAGFGSSIEFDPSQNPLLKRIGRVGDLDNATVNDAFRIVHDLYGHYGPGNPFFRAPGEERAYLLHRRMYSPEALPAMTSETRGQNSWLNYGPHGPSNRNAASEDTVFADQKTGVMEPFTYLEKAGGGAVREGYAGKGFVSDKNVEAALKYLQREFGNLPPAPVDKVFRSEGSDLVRKSRNFERGVPALGNERYGVPLTEMQAEYDEVRPLIDYLKKRPHDLVKENAVIYPAVGDLSAAGKRLAKVGANRLANPTDLHGGFEFARDRFGQGDAPAAWASREDAANTMAERLAERTKEGEVPYLTSVSMGPEAVDSTHMMADTIIKMIPNSKIARADIAKFDAEMKKTYPDWPGIAKTDKALAFMNARGRPGSHLSDFVKKMDKKEYRAAGFPDAGEVRFAVSEPRLIGLPLGSSGFSFMKVEPTLETMTAGPQHGTYSNKIKSPEGYSGGFQNITPSRLMFPQWFEKLHPNAKVDPSKAQWSMITQFPKQKATNEWADNIEKYWEENPMPWGYADGGAVDDDIVDAVRLAKDVGGGTAPVMMEDAKGNKYDAQGNLIPPTAPGPNPARTDAPQAVAQRAVSNPATYDALMEYYAVPDRDIADYEATKAAVAAQPRETQQMTHVGAKPRREVTVDMPLFGGEYSMGTAPYDVAPGMSGMAQTAYDLKTVPFYLNPFTAPVAAGMDVAEGVATNDPLTASLAIGFGPGGKYAKAAGIGAANYFLDPAEAEAGPARWFSKAMEAAQALPMEKMTGQQALAMLRKSVSPEELRWTGAEAFLPQQKQITKQDLVDYLTKNRVQTQNVVLGGNKPTRLADVKVEDVPAEIRQKYEPKINELMEKKTRANLAARGIKQSLGGDPTNPLHLKDQTYLSLLQDGIDYNGEIIDLHEAMKQEYVDSIGGLSTPTKYQDYSTPGGQDYRETLIRLGSSQRPNVVQKDRMWHIVGPDGETLRNQSGGPYTYYSQADAERAAKSLHREGGKFRSGHWDEPDVISHVRSQILDVTPEGANRPYKAFNVDETQSDWAQAGRKSGVKDLSKNWRKEYDNAVKANTNEWVEQKAKAAFDAAPHYYDNDFEKARSYALTVARQKGANKIADELGRGEEYRSLFEAMNKEQYMVEAAPYISSTQGWTDLSIKKSLDQALDAGADYFTFTPGEAQAERFNLQKHISKVQYNPDDGSLLAYDPNGKMVVNESISDPSDLDEYIGKELADKMRLEEESRRSAIEEYEIVKDPETGEWGVYLYGEPSGETFPSKGHAKDYLNEMLANEFASSPLELSGLDLKTGGEGMIDYYNNIYKKRVEKVVKDATGQKVQWEVIPVQTADGPREQLGFRLTDDFQRARFSDFKKGGRVTGSTKYADSDTVGRALALTSEV